jgi:sigma-B regulation protein RsbU (phosphoserine phosphatase)
MIGDKYKGAELLNQLLDNIDDNIYFKDKMSRFILINQAFANRLGLQPDDVVGKTDFDIFTEEHARPAFLAEQQIMETGEPILALEEKETWASGRDTWASTSKMPLRDKDGNIIGTFGMSRDITEHKLGEIKLHQYARRLTQINKQMEDDLRMAANLQQAFLPQSYPTFRKGGPDVQFFHRYIASTQVSGDLCDIHKLSEQEAGMLVCDVMGHGVRSALITAIVHTMIGELIRRNLSPGKFFSEMNRQLRPIFKAQDSFIFVTASYLVLNTETGTLRGASAGHTTPFIVRSNGSSNESEPLLAFDHINGPALAVVENFEYKTCEIQLDPGDAVLMYTDGLIEEPNQDNEEFGIDRIRKTLCQQPDNDPVTLCNALVESVCSFQECSQLDDDICLLAFRWNG